MLDVGVDVSDVGVEKEVVGTEFEKEVVVRQGIAYSSLGSAS